MNMFKKKLILLMSMALMSSFNIACSDSDDSSTTITAKEKYPLTTFALKMADGSYYHAKIDQTAHTVTIGSIDNINSIIGVDYTLMSDETTITPKPESFMGKWEQEQTVAVTTEDNTTTTYTIILPKYNEELTDLIFMEDFDTDGNPDADKWVLCPKGTSNWNNEMSGSYDQAYVENGNLVLKAEKIDGVYKAGGIKTEGKFDFTFGRVEVRARLTKTPNGAFPAIWLMPKKYAYMGWPAGGEIDIMEHVNQESVIYHTIHTHYTYDLGNGGNSRTVTCNYKDYNVYGLEWTPEELRFSVNGKRTFTYKNLHLDDEVTFKQWPFNERSSFYIILNMGLGGEGGWVGNVDDKNLPAIMEVDWVKVFKPKAE